MNRLRNLVIFCVLALVLVVLVFLLSNWNRAASLGKPMNVPNIRADLEVGNLFLTEEKGGTILWELKARIAQSFKEGSRTLLEDLRVTLYDQDGRVVTLRGDQARINDKTRDMEVEGSVVVTSSDGLCLKTSSLHYDHGRREITTDAPVKIDGKGVRVSGMGLLMDLTKEMISIRGGVETFIQGAPWESG
jgi:LPS export ABC transporter protein LptC